MSAENVELIRSIQPRPETDLVTLYADAGAARQADRLGPLLDPGFECAMHLFPGAHRLSVRGWTACAPAGVTGSPHGRATELKSTN